MFFLFLKASSSLDKSQRDALVDKALGPADKKTRQQALKYLDEIAARKSRPVLLLLDWFLRHLWNRLYSGVRVLGLEKIRAEADHFTLVYLPCHRSHIDYLLLSYVLFQEGLTPPHIAAGDNLNLPFLGPLLRRGGAFFMRRHFKDQPLYKAVFNQYLHHLYQQGHAVEFFMEGKRSRTGLTLAPRPGLLRVTLEAALQGTTKPLLLVPVYFGYEKVLEASAYVEELRGQAKKKESPAGFWRLLPYLRQKWGQVDVSFGEPLALQGECLSHLQAQAENTRAYALGHRLAQAINQAATLNRVNLIALAFLASSETSITESQLLKQAGLLAALAEVEPVAALPQGGPAHWLDVCEQLDLIQQAVSDKKSEDTKSEGIYFCSPQQKALLTWHANNVLHLFALPGLIAVLLITEAPLVPAQLEARVGRIYPLLADALFLSEQGLSQRLEGYLQQLQTLGLIEQTSTHCWQLRSKTEQPCCELQGLAQLVQPFLAARKAV